MMSDSTQEKAVAIMQAYIDAHLQQPISLLDLAKSCGYSPYHASRLFKQVTGKTPFDYIYRNCFYPSH
jgi:AraC-like DNA-binding protein